MTKQTKETTIYIAFDDYVQFDPAQPEKGLLRAILMNALSDLRKPGELSRRAREYFLSAEEDYIFSFNSVCSYLDIDPQKILVVAGLMERAQAAAAEVQSVDAALKKAAEMIEPIPEPVEA